MELTDALSELGDGRTVRAMIHWARPVCGGDEAEMLDAALRALDDSDDGAAERLAADFDRLCADKEFAYHPQRTMWRSAVSAAITLRRDRWLPDPFWLVRNGRLAGLTDGELWAYIVAEVGAGASEQAREVACALAAGWAGTLTGLIAAAGMLEAAGA